MATGRYISRQRDFSGGEVVEHAKRRDDEAIIRSSLRTGRNIHIMSSGAVEQRPGRSALFADGPTEQVRMSATYTVYLSFGDGTLTIRDSTGATVASQSGYAWTKATAKNIVFDVFNNDVVICFPGQQPKLATWDGNTSWSFGNWTPTTTSAGRKLVPFVRFAPAGVTMALSGLSGSVTVTFSANVLVAGHVGTRMRYYDKQITITAVTNGTTGTATINEVLRELSSIDFTANVTDQFSVGDIVEGATSGRRGYVAEVGTPGADDITDIRLTAAGYAIPETVIGPSGSAITQAFNADPTSAPAITVWDEELFNDHRGWPQSVTVDQNRLIFSDFPGMPEAIAWSASGDHTNFASGLAEDADPTDAIVEFAPKKSRVYHVRPGADEFVFTDQGIYYIPISESNPLRPGSVAFRQIPGASASKIEPVSTAQGVAYVNAGQNRVLAIVSTGQTAMPYIIRPASDLHSHLFSGIVCIEVYEGDGNPPDELVFAVNGDGTVVVGRFQPGKEWVGWVIWSGSGSVKWVSALSTTILFSTNYTAGSLVEQLDEDRYLDAAVDYDAIPTALAAGVGQGPLWFLAGDTLNVMDGLRNIGTRVIDASGDVTLQEGDAFTDETFGHKFGDVIVEPFVPHVGPGQSVSQSMNKRQITDAAVAVQNSTGFRVEKWNPQTQAWETAYTRSPYDAGEDEGANPPLREEVVEPNVSGSDHDPRWRVIKDYPGSLRVLEMGVETGP